MSLRRIIILIVPLIFIVVTGCKIHKDKSDKQVVWVYTSLYKDIIEQIRPVLEQELPDIEIKWFASGSEKVLTKVNAELAAGQTKADIIMTSDPFWYEQLCKGGLLLQYESSAASRIPNNFKDPNNCWVTARIPVMVIAYNSDILSFEEAPKSFKELTSDKWKGKVALGSPLESGTNFATVANISRRYGWNYYETLRKNDTYSAGGNSSVRRKIESKEYPVGVILLENVLQAKRGGSPMREIYPSDGVIMIPSPVAIFKSTKVEKAAKRFYDFILSQKGQYAIIGGNMYSPFQGYPPPDGAKPFDEVLANAFPFDHSFVKTVLESHEEIKTRYSKIMLE